MEEIIENIQQIKDELEIRVQDYKTPDQMPDSGVEDPNYVNLDDNFFEFYPKEKPFLVEVGRIKKSNF